MLFIDYSSASNSIVPTKLITKLRIRILRLNTSLCNWIEQAPININGAVVDRVESFKSLGVHITNELSWSKHTKTVVKRARQHLFSLKRPKRFGMGLQILKKFYNCTIESILTGCNTTRYGN
jgi:hypothetical protein